MDKNVEEVVPELKRQDAFYIADDDKIEEELGALIDQLIKEQEDQQKTQIPAKSKTTE